MLKWVKPSIMLKIIFAAAFKIVHKFERRFLLGSYLPLSAIHICNKENISFQGYMLYNIQ